MWLTQQSIGQNGEENMKSVQGKSCNATTADGSDIGTYLDQSQVKRAFSKWVGW
ncbi:hypothetical protein LIA77_01100 [Sarocladium implicatum]|nr:hypothetical protein LIA77_01100 [Sarocladium implicatum]